MNCFQWAIYCNSSQSFIIIYSYSLDYQVWELFAGWFKLKRSTLQLILFYRSGILCIIIGDEHQFMVLFYPWKFLLLFLIFAIYTKTSRKQHLIGGIIHCIIVIYRIVLLTAFREYLNEKLYDSSPRKIFSLFVVVTCLPSSSNDWTVVSILSTVSRAAKLAVKVANINTMNSQ